MSNLHSRRSVLEAGAAVTSLAVAGSLSGCSSLFGGDDFDYVDWLYAPGTVQDVDHYWFTAVDLGTWHDHEDELGDGYEELREDTMDFPLEQMNVDFEQVEHELLVGAGGVYIGDFDEDSVVDALEADGYAETDTYEGYSLYRDETDEQFEDLERYIAIDGETVVANAGIANGSDARDGLEALVDAGAGEQTRYMDDNEDFAILTDELDSGSFVYGETMEPVAETDVSSGEFAGTVANGTRTRLDGGQTTFTAVLVFEGSEEIDVEDIEAWTETDDFDGADLWEGIDITVSGRTVTVTGETETAEIYE